MRLAGGSSMTASSVELPWLGKISTGQCLTHDCTARPLLAVPGQFPDASIVSRTTTQAPTAPRTQDSRGMGGFPARLYGHPHQCRRQAQTPDSQVKCAGDTMRGGADTHDAGTHMCALIVGHAIHGYHAHATAHGSSEGRDLR